MSINKKTIYAVVREIDQRNAHADLILSTFSTIAAAEAYIRGLEENTTSRQWQGALQMLGARAVHVIRTVDLWTEEGEYDGQ